MKDFFVFLSLILILLLEVYNFENKAKVISGNIGLPIDDAWIHLTYAKNILEEHKFSYPKQEWSVGSTSILWTLILSSFLTILKEPIITAHSLGILFFILLIFIFYKFSLFISNSHIISFFSSLICILEGHLLWASLSGMETIFFTFLIILITYLYLKTKRLYLVSFLSGILTLTRPEGAILFFVILIDLIRNYNFKKVIFSILIYSITLSPWFIFNLALSGNLFPNTFYAKIDFTQPRLSFVKYISYLIFYIWGGLLFLLPFFIYNIIKNYKNSKYFILIFFPLFLISFYIIRFPILFHYGRYIMPVFPFYIFLGVEGVFKLFSKNYLRRYIIFYMFCILLLISLFINFYFNNMADNYAMSVENINSMQVKIGKWLNENTQEDSLVATNDIGAIGFFSKRKIIDTCGIITPEIIPIMSSEDKILKFLKSKKVDYLVIFPDWYPNIAKSKDLTQLYEVELENNVICGSEKMVVYKTRW